MTPDTDPVERLGWLIIAGAVVMWIVVGLVFWANWGRCE